MWGGRTWVTDGCQSMGGSVVPFRQEEVNFFDKQTGPTNEPIMFDGIDLNSIGFDLHALELPMLPDLFGPTTVLQ
jgi:hypothetical protein